MFNPGDIISYIDLCLKEKASLQRGMNFRLHNNRSIILMSLRKGAPYADRIEDEGRVLIYEGHDIPQKKGGVDPKTSDQPYTTPNGTLTQNGLFFEAAINFKNKKKDSELVRVYEKIHSGIWSYNGLFKLVDAWQESINARKVFKFRLELTEDFEKMENLINNLDHNRLIPSSVKLFVWQRDKGRCTVCGSNDNLHFDHIIPYSKGGSSLIAENIQLLCARHNLAKKDNIE